jgi:hypothetical protein
MDSEDGKLLANCPGVQSGRLLPELYRLTWQEVECGF